MKAGDIIGISSNPLIKAATLSKFSHVAIALDSENTFEILTGGTRKTTLNNCISEAKSALLLQRPEPLTEDLIAILSSELERIIEKEEKYGYTRMLYAGILPAARNVFFITALAFITYAYLSDKAWILPIPFLILMFNPIVALIQRFTRNKSITIALEKLGVPDCLLKELSGQFCSQLVVDLDYKTGGRIAKVLNAVHEPRPNDVVRACKELGYAELTLK